MNTKAVDVLLREYSEMRAEMLLSVQSSESNFRYAGSTLIAIIGAAISFKRIEIIFLLPSAILIFSIIQFSTLTAQQVLGIYLTQIESKLKSHFDPGEILMTWQGETEREIIVSPFGPVQLGILITSLFAAILFCVSAFFAFEEYPVTIYLHLIEFILLVFYYFSSTRLKRRNNQLSITEEISQN